MFDFGLNKRKDEGKNPHYLLRLSHSQGKIMLNHQSDQSDCQLLWKGKRWPWPQYSALDWRIAQKNNEGSVQSYKNIGGEDQSFFY